jgi:hypothetical protein
LLIFRLAHLQAKWLLVADHASDKLNPTCHNTALGSDKPSSQSFPPAIEYSSAFPDVCKVAQELRMMQNYLCYLCDLRIAQLMIDFFE